MHNLYHKLSKILKLEQQKRFNNSVVIGGLEGFLAFWVTDARKKASNSLDKQKVEEVQQRLQGYGNMPIQTRKDNVLYVLERLNIGETKYQPKKASSRYTGARREGSVNESSSGYSRAKPHYKSKRTANTSPLDHSISSQQQQHQQQPSNPTPSARPARSQPSKPLEMKKQASPSPQGKVLKPQPSIPATPPHSAAVSSDHASPRKPVGPSRVPIKQPAPTNASELVNQARAARDIGAQHAGQPYAKGNMTGQATQTQKQPSWGTGKHSSPRRRMLPPEVALKLEKELRSKITTLPGIGKTRAKKLEKLEIFTIYDLIYHVPFRYEDYTTIKQIVELQYGDEVTVAAVVQEISMYKSQKGTVVVNGIVGDGTGKLRVSWFGNRYIVNHLRQGTMVRLSGKIDAYMGRLKMSSPRFEVITTSELKSNLLVPVYSKTEGVSEKALKGYIDIALDQYAARIPDPLPPEIRDHYELIKLSQAIRWVHKASSLEQVRIAQKRLAFDDLLRLQLGMLQQRAAWQNQPGNAITVNQDVISRFYSTLPFELTGAQQRCVNEILADMGKSCAMSRLLQGDVGSGKTAVAATALLAAVSAGFQAALMAPTEILAEQHFVGVQKFLNPNDTLLLGERPIRFVLLTGSLSASKKREAREAIANGEADIIIGTHALIQDDVTYPNLGLAVVDEQHRFGVKQRGALRKRTQNDIAPDLLVMSATPIPRSLALTLYGDLELSIIDEMPPGRQTIITRSITPDLRERAYTYIRRQVQEGRQAFIICPLVEESEKLEARAAVEEHSFLQKEVFPEYSVELLHGRMKSSEKEEAMGRFYRNESQILVSTSVVEVGIDVPNANVMLIEGANRFGLAQLHQFRGRIGRGQWRSLCLLMAVENISEEGEKRLQVLVDNSDGFALAEEDLQMRGPGDFFGTRQSGMLELKMAKLGDTLTLSKAREVAKQIIHHDPELNHPAHQLLKSQIESYWNKENDGAS